MTDSIVTVVFILHLASTLFMAGLIWFVQIVHYPLFARVGSSQFAKYEQAHTRLTTWVVGPPMLVETITGVLLLWTRPAGVSLAQASIGAALLAVILISTQLIQVPCHERLLRAFDPAVHRRLVTTNWIRTVAWSLRGVLVAWMAISH